PVAVPPGRPGGAEVRAGQVVARRISNRSSRPLVEAVGGDQSGRLGRGARWRLQNQQQRPERSGNRQAGDGDAPRDHASSFGKLGDMNGSWNKRVLPQCDLGPVLTLPQTLVEPGLATEVAVLFRAQPVREAALGKLDVVVGQDRVLRDLAFEAAALHETL